MTHPLIFGEVLFDHFPDDSVILGGAPFNVAWHLQAFGVNPCFISRVGDDELGKDIRNSMREWGMDSTGLQTDSTHPTGTVQVRINKGEPSYEIVPDQAYDFIDASQLPPLNNDFSILYHGSLALRNPVSRNALTELRAKLNIPIFVDVNLRPPWWDKEAVVSQIKDAHWVKLNDDELNQLITGEATLENKAKSLQNAYDLTLVIITQGAKGAFARTANGIIYQIKPDKLDPLIDVVGAGDAFTSVVLLGLLNNWDTDLILYRAQSFASAIVGIRGATPTDKELYNNFIHTWSKA